MKQLSLLIIALALLQSISAFSRERQSFDQGWLFTLNPKDSALYQNDVNDNGWRRLNLPHDWAIEGDFSVSNPSGAGGGALPGGIGWYRKHFKANLTKDEKLYVDFDGVYMNSTVWINGHKLGTRPYGYSSFQYDLTPYINNGDNVIAVKVDNSDQPNSRWYSGCGIYRHVWLTKTNNLHIAHWGTQVVTDAKGTITISVALQGRPVWSPATATTSGRGRPHGSPLQIRNTVYDAAGKQVVSNVTTNVSYAGTECRQLKVSHPHLWSTDDPYCYIVKTEVIVNNKTVDEVTTRTAFRDFRFDAKTGFWLNGKNMKLNGVCEHHDLGCLGAAFNDDAMLRKLYRLKAMGVNALRCTHNPPAPQLLDMCDTLGFVVMDESFDMWRRKKTQNDYARYFDEWHERDLSDMVLRDRNHPSIIMWSIGNEVLEQWSSANADELTLEQANLILNAGHDASTLAHGDEMTPNALLTQHLANIIKKYDTTRPITAGCNEPSPDNHLFKSGALDIIGFNYHHQWIKDVPKNFPGKPFLLSESVSALATRGYYQMPSDSMFIEPDRWDIPFADPSMMCSSYDNCHVPWGSTQEETWDVVKHTPWCAGQFIWTGFDYIGEPTPYGFPARSSYFGVIDLAGFPKDTYYLYQSEWTGNQGSADGHKGRTLQPHNVLHLFPHWNWNEGQTVDMWCYYNNADSVELFINGKSQGFSKKTEHKYHASWRVKYEPGEVKVVAYNHLQGAGLVPVRTETIRTAGSPYTIRLTKDFDGKNTLFISAEVVDKDGNLCPWAEDDITFSVDGGEIIGVDNGSQFSTERFKANHRKAFFGKAMVVIQKGTSHAETADGSKITVKAMSPMLKTATAIF